MLNEFSRFGHGRIGASVTYTGRQINTHMVNTVTSALYPDGKSPTLIKQFDPYNKKDSKTGTDGLHDTRWGANVYIMPIQKGAGAIYGDTDSVAGESVVTLNGVTGTIEKLFESIPGVMHNSEDKEFKQVNKCTSITNEPVSAIYRHKTSKRKFKITTENGKQVIVTEDHSIMVKRDGILQEIKPMEINIETDICISI